MLLFNEAILHNKTVHSGVMWVPGLPRELILEFCCQFTNSKLREFFLIFLIMRAILTGILVKAFFSFPGRPKSFMNLL